MRAWDRKVKKAARRCVDKQATAGGLRDAVLLGTSKIWLRSGCRVVLLRKKKARIESHAPTQVHHLLRVAPAVFILLALSACSVSAQASSWGQGNASGKSQVLAARVSATKHCNLHLSGYLENPGSVHLSSIHPQVPISTLLFQS